MALYFIDTANGNDASDGLTWTTRWKTYAHAGTVMVAGDTLQTVQPSNNYIVSADVKAAFPNETWGTSYDTYLADICTSASRAVDAFTRVREGEWLAATSASYRYFDGSGGRYQDIDPCISITDVAVDETGAASYTAWATTEYLTYPYNPDSIEPITRLDIDLRQTTKDIWYKYQKSVRVNARWGRSATVPRWVFDVALIHAVRRFKRAQQAFQDAGAITELHQLKYVQELDPEEKALIEVRGFGGADL